MDAQQPAVGADTGPNRTFPFDLSTDVAANTGRTDPVTVSVEIPYRSRITRVLLGYPAGTQQAVGAQVGTPGGENWVPRGGVNEAEYVAFDDRNIEVGVNVEIEPDQPVQASFINNDPNNAHFINVLVFAEEL